MVKSVCGKMAVDRHFGQRQEAPKNDTRWCSGASMFKVFVNNEHDMLIDAPLNILIGISCEVPETATVNLRTQNHLTGHYRDGQMCFMQYHTSLSVH